MLKFYICSICGNLILKIEDGGTVPSCCGKQMMLLEPGTSDGAVEKHVPVFSVHNKPQMKRIVHVDVGSFPHPTDEKHYIQWIILQTNHGIYIHHLKPGELPQWNFILDDDEQIGNVYAYCNLHGLWIC